MTGSTIAVIETIEIYDLNSYTIPLIEQWFQWLIPKPCGFGGLDFSQRLPLCVS